MENIAENPNPVIASEPIKNITKPTTNIVEEKAPDSSEGIAQKSRNSKAKKRKKPKDTTAPRQPLTGKLCAIRLHIL